MYTAEDLIKELSKKPQAEVRVLNGEWGEGQTDCEIHCIEDTDHENEVYLITGKTNNVTPVELILRTLLLANYRWVAKYKGEVWAFGGKPYKTDEGEWHTLDYTGRRPLCINKLWPGPSKYFDAIPEKTETPTFIEHILPQEVK